MKRWTMRRREFITFLGGAAAAWPLAAREQQIERMRRIGMLMSGAIDDSQSPLRIEAFLGGLRRLGWTEGRNLRIDVRWAAGDSQRIRNYAAELIALAPDVVLATGGSTVGPLQRVTRTVPIVFVLVPDPVGAGFVASLARPSGNTTGFANFEYGISAKWLELLKQIAPDVTRVAVLRDQSTPDGIGQFAAMQGVAPAFGAELSPVDVRFPGELDRALGAFAGGSNSGVVVTSSALAILHREVITASAARHKLPAVYPFSLFVTGGGLICYGPNMFEQYRQAATYVDRILKGEKPGDLPVQAPTKYEMVLNLKTAKALGLQVPDVVRLRADEVIE